MIFLCFFSHFEFAKIVKIFHYEENIFLLLSLFHFMKKNSPLYGIVK